MKPYCGANSDINTNLDSNSLESAIVGCLNVLGEDEVMKLLSKCDFAHNLFLEDDEENEEPESLIEDDNEDSLDPTYPEEVETSV